MSNADEKRDEIKQTKHVNAAWHALPLQAVLDQLQTDPKTGLSEQEAANRLGQYGPNALHERPRPTFWHRLAAQFESFVIYILIFAAIL